MNPLFSIIIPVFNVARELRRAVKSVQDQDFTEWEIVLVDDGSTAGSAELCNQLAAEDHRIKALHQINSGVVAARQRGFEVSHGVWIMFLDGDDALKSGCLHKIENVLKGKGADIVQFGYDTELANGKVSQHPSMTTGMKIFEWVISHSSKTPLDILEMCIGNKCYKREIVSAAFADVGDVRIAHSEDGLFAFAAFLHADRLLFLPDIFYRYIMRGSSAVHKVNVHIVDEKQKFIDAMESLAQKSGRMTEEKIRCMIEFHAYQACCYIFLMLKRNNADAHQIKQILLAVIKSRFYRMPNREWHSIKRKCMRFLLAHPRTYTALCLLGGVK